MSHCDLGLVSIIVPCYNHAEWLRCSLDSCLAQTYPNIEIIVVDDGSTDGSADIMREFASRWPEKIQIKLQPHRSVAAARNRAFELSHGEYIQFLDADDYLLPEKISGQVGRLESTGADIFFGPWRYHRHPPDAPDYLAEIDTREIPDDLILAMLTGWWIPPVAALHRRTLVEKLDGFDERYTNCEDTIFYFLAALHGARFACSSHCHSVYRRQGTRATWTGNRNSAKQMIEVTRECEATLAAAGRLGPAYRKALANGYWALAPGIFGRDSQEFYRIIDHADSLSPSDGSTPRGLDHTARSALGDRDAARLANSVHIARRFRRLFRR